MILLTKRGADIQPHYICIFGIGLIGSAIVNSFLRLSEYSLQRFPFSWNNLTRQLQDCEFIKSSLRTMLVEDKTTLRESKTVNVTFIWSAGQSGFYDLGADLEIEFSNYCAVVGIAKYIQSIFIDLKLEFQLISSAGGLFENQGFVTSSSAFNIARPYGELKLKQEEYLYKFNHIISKIIYRLPTVYGAYKYGGREGLISTIIFNCFNNRTTVIQGSLTTLRDYVYCEDIGDYIVSHVLNKIGSNFRQTQIKYLCSGKPSSIYEIKKLVEKMLNRKVYLQFQNTPQNVNNIAFHHRLKPYDWHPRDLYTGIISVYRKLLLNQEILPSQFTKQVEYDHQLT